MQPKQDGLSGSVTIDFDKIRATRERIMQAGKALNTRRAYQSAWKAFCAWCQQAGREPLPATPETVRDFLTWEITQHLRIGTLQIRTSAIRHFHIEAGHPLPCNASVREYLHNAARELKEEPRGRAALTYDHLCRIAKDLSHPMRPTQVRSRAMILLGFASGWRRSELLALNYRDVTFVPKGLTLWQAFSKTDQTAEGRLVGIEAGKKALTCPVRALRAWLKIRGEWEGPLFVPVRCSGQDDTRASVPARRCAVARCQACD